MRKRPLLVGGTLLVIVGVLAAAQLALPGIAAQRLRDRLSHSGRVLEVRVAAFPAIELLWHHADRVVIRMASYASSAASLEHEVSQVIDADSLDASAGRLSAGLLTLRDASLRKRGSVITGKATVTEADLRASLPVLDSVTPVASAGGQLTLQGTASVFGLTATADATVQPVHGTLVVSPDVPFGTLATITVFSSPRIAIQSVSASPVAGGFVASVRARVK